MFNRIDQGMYWDRAWKLVEGCTPVSDGCAHCWSARETRMRANNPNGKISTRNRGLTKVSPLPSRGEVGESRVRGCSFNGKIRLRVDNLDLPLRTKKPTVFAIWNDLFHEDVPWDFIDMAHTAMWKASQHLFFILTKRPERMLDYMAGKGGPNTPGLKPLPNVWLGVTAENQEQANRRILVLLKTSAVKRYVSIEPMLGPVDIPHLLTQAIGSRNIDWVICGGESGPGARPMHPEWATSLRDQCHVAGTPFFFKQWGEYKAAADPFEGVKFAKMARKPQCCQAPGSPLILWNIGKKAAGRILDGKEYLELPDIGTRRQGDTEK